LGIGVAWVGWAGLGAKACRPHAGVGNGIGGQAAFRTGGSLLLCQLTPPRGQTRRRVQHAEGQRGGVPNPECALPWHSQPKPQPQSQPKFTRGPPLFRVNQIAMDTLGNRCVTASSDGTAKAWSMADGRLQWTMTGHGATGATGAVRASAARGARAATLPPRGAPMHASKRLGGLVNLVRLGLVKLCALTRNWGASVPCRPSCRPRRRALQVLDVALSVNGRLAATGGSDFTARWAGARPRVGGRACQRGRWPRHRAADDAPRADFWGVLELISPTSGAASVRCPPPHTKTHATQREQDMGPEHEEAPAFAGGPPRLGGWRRGGEGEGARGSCGCVAGWQRV
jgi:hypothetical protein